MKRIACFILMTALLMISAAGICDSLFVDNRETDKVYPERLNLRSEPSMNGAILGLYYTGAEVERLDGGNEDYTQVQIGGLSGYMASEYLITAEEALARYGADSGFGDCRVAQVNCSGLWTSSIEMVSGVDPLSASVGVLSDGMQVTLIGLGDDWAYIAADLDGVTTYGYVPLNVLTDIEEREVVIVAGSRADTQTNLYDAPNDKANLIMVLKNGTACFNVFGRKEGNWYKVRVGGVTGWVRYTQADNLVALSDPSVRSTIPYYPLAMQTKTDALLYSVMGDKNSQYMTLGQGMKVEVLAECENYAYVRTMEGGAGAYNSGDYGYIALSDLSLAASEGGVGIAQADDGDLPVLLLESADADADMIGALIGGAQVHITDYTQTDYLQVALGDVTGYVLKSQIRVLGSEGTEASDRIPQRASVQQDIVLRTSPQDSGDEVAQVAAQSRVYMLAVCGEWAYVQASEQPGLMQEGGETAGFVRLTELVAPASTTHLTAFSNTDKVNLRASGSKNAEIIGRVRTGERLRVADYGTQWTCVVTPDGKRGYVMTDYLEFE